MGGTGSFERGPDGGGHHGVPVVLCHVLDPGGSKGRGDGVVDHAVQPPMGRDGRLHGGSEVVGRGHVTADAPDVVSGLPELDGGGLAGLGSSTGQHDRRPVGRHGRGHPEAQS